ncbi:MAG: transporter substrate-binding protein [Rhodoferax sp.]|nr:transporter substrate-binding protein [Rhodoferax sp.]
MHSHSPGRRRFTAGIAVAAAAVAVPTLRAQVKLEKTSIAIAVGGKAAFYYLPLTIAEQLGYFKAEGLDVEINDQPSGMRALQMVTSGAVDVCSGAFEHTIQLQSRSQFFQSFVLQGRAPQIAIGVSTKTMPEFRTLADLRGRRIGVSSTGSSTHMVANLVLLRAGIRTSDVAFVGVGTSANALNALRSGQIDAMSNADPVMTMLEQRGEVRIVSDTRTLKGAQELFGGAMPAACLHASNDFVRKNPNTTQALANAIVRSLKWLQTAGPSDIIKTVPEGDLLGDRALYLASFSKVRDAISPNGLVPDDGPATALKALSTLDPAIKPDQIALAKTYTNEFALRARDKYKA